MHCPFTIALTIISLMLFSAVATAQSYNGLDQGMGNLHLLSKAKTRSISPENFTGEPGKGAMAVPDPDAPVNTANATRAARDLGQGWKVNPYVHVEPGQEFVMGEIEGEGCIQHIWLTVGMQKRMRYWIIRMYWDGEDEPSVEVPVGDFFACGWGEYAQVVSPAICVNPGSGMNCYWPMPFQKSAKITIENTDEKRMTVYYQIDYTLTDVPNDAAYFHAQFRRENPVRYRREYTLIDNVKGKGHYVGTYMAWQVNNDGWWGEGEIKFFMDGDTEFPTIAGTGTEDYFCGSYCFRVDGEYQPYCTPYAGMPQVRRPDGEYKANTRFGLYRWHIMDPVRFEDELKVTMQALGWRDNGRYLALQDDISSVVYWYQEEPHNPFPPLPSKDRLEIQ